MSICDCRVNTPVYTLVATSPPGEKQRGRDHEPDFVGVLLTLIRLEKHETDLIVAINVPHTKGSYDETGIEFEVGKMGALMEEATKMRNELMRTLEVKDWGLFES